MAIPKLTITQHDGTEITVTPNLWDTFAFEKFLKANPRLGTLQENTLKLQAFRAWHAASQRLGLIEQTWDEFTNSPQAALQVTQTEETEADEDVLGLGLGTAAAPSPS